MDASSPASPGVASTRARPAFGEALRIWAWIGCVNFGGPAGQIALMHRVLVEEKRWIGEPQFLHALNYCMLLPGPEAQQLATYVGWLLHGVRGGVAAGILFVLPGFLVLLGLSAAYVLIGDLPAVQGVLFGLKAAVLAIVAEALLRVGRRALKTPAAVAMAVAAFLAIAVFRVPFPLVIVAAGGLGLAAPDFALPARADGERAGDPPLADDDWPARASPGWMSTLHTVAIWGCIWLGPVALLALGLGLDNVLTREALFFSKAAVVTFGGAYAVLSYVAQQAVDTYHWLRPDEMLTGLGLAETTPGPLILVLVFVGFLAGFRGATGLDPLAAGIAGACVTAWVIFAPSFLFIFAGAPYVERLRANRRAAGALAAITAAVVGVIANLAVWFGLHVLFREIGEAAFGPAALPVPRLASFDAPAALIALAAGLALLRLHIGIVPVLALAAAGGVALHGLAPG